MYVVLSVLLCYMLGTTSRPVGVAYHFVYIGACLSSVLTYDAIYFLYGVEDGVVYTDTYTYFWRMGLAGSSAMAYLYVFVACLIFRRLVPILGRGG